MSDELQICLQACGISGATGGFNVAKLSGTVKTLTADAQTLKKNHGKTVTVAIKVQRRKEAQTAQCVGAGMLLAPGGIDDTAHQQAREGAEDGGDDGGDGGDGGD